MIKPSNQMKKHLLNFLLSTLVLILFDCKKDKDEDVCPGVTFDDLRITQIDAPTRSSNSSKVSLLLKVDENVGNKLPVAGLMPSNFTIYEKGINDACPNPVSESEANKRFSPNPQVFSHFTLIVLDLSASVTSSSLTELKSSTISFIENVILDPNDRSYQLGISWFDGEDKLNTLIDFTSNKNALISAVNNISTDLSNDPSTDLYGATIKATERAEQKLAQLQNANVISAYSLVLFTDGTDQAARYPKQRAFDKVSNADAKISFFTIGLGGEIDPAILSTLGKNGSIISADKNQLVAKFLEVAQLVKKEANSYYLFEYCTPKRGGNVELSIVVNDGSKKGTMKYSFSADGITSNCN